MFHPDPARKLSANLYDIYHCCVFVCLFVFGRDSPQWARASSFTRILDNTQDAPQSVGLLWVSDQLIAETSA